jgi:hypothetical protein
MIDNKKLDKQLDAMDKFIDKENKKFDDYMSKMHNFTKSEKRLKDILFHSLYLLAQNHKMTQEDAMHFVEEDCASLHWNQNESESA